MTGSVAFGVSCVFTLLFTQNLAQSVLVGLATMPGVAASLTVRSRHRQQRVHRQLKRGRLRLNELQQQGAVLTHQLQLQCKDRQTIELRVSQLHSLVASLNDRISQDRDRHQQLEQQLSTLTVYIQEQQHLAEKLDRKIQAKQASSLEVEADLNNIQAKSARIQHEQNQLIGANDRAKISLSNIQLQIDRCLTTKQELELQIQQIQSQKRSDDGDFDRSIEQKHLLLHQLDSAISNRQKIQQELATEVDRLERVIAEKSPAAIVQAQKLAQINSQLSEAELESIARQKQLQDLSAAILVQQDRLLQARDYDLETADFTPAQLSHRELKIAELELSSRKAELDNLELKIQVRLQEIDEMDLAKSLQTFEPKPPTIDRQLDLIAGTGAWEAKFIDNPHLRVLQHIEKHGTITEAEASSKLGNTRSVRQFANKLAEYTRDLPFSIRVESSPKGNRYIKEIQD
jgi:chromosome segregation ATPase